jgi:peptide chain release factor 2
MKHLKSLTKFGGIFDIPIKRERLQDLDDQINADPNFWNDPKKSAPILKEKKGIELILENSRKLETTKDDLQAALELAPEGEEFIDEAITLLASLEVQLATLEVESLLGGELDSNNAVLTINAGAGGTESCDWASMLMRMYIRFGERKGWKTNLIDIQEGDEAGIKSATIEFEGHLAFGHLKAESGVHRLVRISPFDSAARRHTSFASIFLTAVIDDEIEIDVNPADLRIDTYRASGAGGQHVNRTDSAVRITHEPSGIVVQSQTQRSQHQNKDKCMKLLKSKLYELELSKRQEKQQAVEDQKSEIAFGSQIRSYVLHPYKMVKDHRTSKESHSPDAVLDGDLDNFIKEFLVNRKK